MEAASFTAKHEARIECPRIMHHGLGGPRMYRELGLTTEEPSKTVASVFANSLDRILTLKLNNAICYSKTLGDTFVVSESTARDSMYDESCLTAVRPQPLNYARDSPTETQETRILFHVDSRVVSIKSVQPHGVL